jgi:PmbA protein
MRASAAEKNRPTEVLSDLISRATRKGATAADAVLIHGTSMSVTHRMGARENLNRSEGHTVGLRVLIGKRQAIVSSTDLTPATLDSLLERALSMARIAPEDPYCGLAEPELLAKSFPKLDLLDAVEPDGEHLYGRAAEVEDAARAVKGITNSDGAGASWGRSEHTLVTSDGFVGSYATSMFGMSVSVVAGAGTAMETDYSMSRARFESDLEDNTAVGREAGERTVRRLNPRKVESMSVPVVLEPRISNSMLGHFASAISGTSIARGTSFLRNDMSKPVFGKGVTVVDDPHRIRGLASRPFDGEGVTTRTMALADEGVLKTWLLSSASARQLGLRTTGHAARGGAAPPGPAASNLYMEPGKASPEELMADIKRGVYVTELIGFGVNMITGDYSRGASGYLIENGKLAGPISEFTIAGNLRTMFAAIVPANDLEFRYSANAPTLRIDGMTVAGK